MRVQADDLACADRNLLRLTPGVLDDRYPLPVNRLPRKREQRQTSVTIERYAFVRKGSDCNECYVEFGVGIEDLVRPKVISHRLAQHAIEIVLVAKFRFALARFVRIPENVVVG